MSPAAAPYDAAIAGLYALAGELHAPAPGQPRRKFELGEMRILAEALGHPQRKFPSILIAGTNGKGSTSATLASILRSAGYRTGLYTSPHLSRVNERVQIDGQQIDDDTFAELYFRVDDAARHLVSEGKLAQHPSFFEAMTAVAFSAFADANVDIAVLEVGMGGRLDATNIVEPLLSVITDISLDHTDWLGSTVTEIAREKAGILRQDGILITLPQHPEANQAIGEAAVALNVRGISAAEYVPAPDAADSTGAYPLQVLGERIVVASPLIGSHQQRNIANAIAAAVELSNHHGYKLTPQQIEIGIRNTQWPGRLETFSTPGQPTILLDVAHNPAGAWALRSAISHLDPAPQRITAIFGCLKDKAVAEIAQILFPLFDQVILTEVSSPRTAQLAGLEAAARATGVRYQTAAGAHAALQQAQTQTQMRTQAGTTDLIVVTGSVYLVGEVRGFLTGEHAGA